MTMEKPCITTPPTLGTRRDGPGWSAKRMERRWQHGTGRKWKGQGGERLAGLNLGGFELSIRWGGGGKGMKGQQSPNRRKREQQEKKGGRMA